MRTKLWIVFLNVFLVFATSGVVSLAGRSSGKTDTPPAASGKPTAAKPVESVDADRVYKAHCGRCHQEPRRFSDRVMVTVMRHMRVRANLTEQEEKAILQYLTR